MRYMERLRYNDKAIKKYKTELTEAISNDDNFEIYLNIGNLLHWIIMMEEWHKSHNKRRSKYENNKREKNMVSILKGIRFANNSMKHNMMFSKLHLNPTAVMCGSAEAICGSFSTGSEEFLWNGVSSFKATNDREQSQYDCYNENLRLKSVVR